MYKVNGRTKCFECGTCIGAGNKPYAVNIEDKNDHQEMWDLSKSNGWMCLCKGGYLMKTCYDMSHRCAKCTPNKSPGDVPTGVTPVDGTGDVSANKSPGGGTGDVSAGVTPGDGTAVVSANKSPGDGTADVSADKSPGDGTADVFANKGNGLRKSMFIPLSDYKNKFTKSLDINSIRFLINFHTYIPSSSLLYKLSTSELFKCQLTHDIKSNRRLLCMTSFLTEGFFGQKNRPGSKVDFRASALSVIDS
jgi:hypothetical protein